MSFAPLFLSLTHAHAWQDRLRRSERERLNVELDEARKQADMLRRMLEEARSTVERQVQALASTPRTPKTKAIGFVPSPRRSPGASADAATQTDSEEATGKKAKRKIKAPALLGVYPCASVCNVVACSVNEYMLVHVHRVYVHRVFVCAGSH